MGDASLFQRWLAFKHALQGEVGLFTQSVAAARTFTLADLRTWPKGEEVRVRESLYRELMAAAKLKRKPLVDSDFSLRSGLTAKKVKAASDAVANWTGHNYDVVQRFLRGQQNTNKGRRLSDNMKTYFERTTCRAPAGAERGVEYLYRGVEQGIGWSEGSDEKGYLAFTPSAFMASVIAGSHGEVWRLRVRDVPRGTPWLWYGRRRRPESVNPEEQEVLLPPGRITRVGGGTVPSFFPIHFKQVTYRPF